jgi:hypothetical protein
MTETPSGTPTTVSLPDGAALQQTVGQLNGSPVPGPQRVKSRFGTFVVRATVRGSRRWILENLSKRASLAQVAEEIADQFVKQTAATR